MPTISAHVDDETEQLVEKAARVSAHKKVGPWLKEAALQRLARDGMSQAGDAELLAKVAAQVKRRPAVKAEIEAILRRGTRAARTEVSPT